MDRHDLSSFRILSARVQDGIADAVIWSGEGAFHRSSPTLHWYADADTEILAEGFAVQVPEHSLYRLEVESPAGDWLYAEVKPGESGSSVMLQREHWFYGEDLSLESRETASVESGSSLVPQNAAARLTVESLTDVFSLRWMHDVGGILELSQTSADFFAKDIHIEEDEITLLDAEVEQMEIFLLAIDGFGASAWKWINLNFQGEERIQHDEQYLPFLPMEDTTRLSIEVHQTADGYELSNPQPVDDLTAASVLSCVPSGESFQLFWIKQGRCSIDELDGHTIVLEVR